MKRPGSKEKTGRASSTPRPAKQSKKAARKESAPDRLVKRRLARSRAKGIAGHVRASGKRRQAQRDKR